MMGHTFQGRNGKTFDRNVAAGEYLSKITLGLWPKIGCYPKTEEDCKLVARILRNLITLNSYWIPYYKELGLEKITDQDITFNKELAVFFETCGGCE